MDCDLELFTFADNYIRPTTRNLPGGARFGKLGYKFFTNNAVSLSSSLCSRLNFINYFKIVFLNTCLLRNLTHSINFIRYFLSSDRFSAAAELIESMIDGYSGSLQRSILTLGQKFLTVLYRCPLYRGDFIRV